MTVDSASVKWHHLSCPGYLLGKWAYRADGYVLEVCRDQRNPLYNWALLSPMQLPLARPSLDDPNVRRLRSGSAGSREEAMGRAVRAYRQWVTENSASALEQSGQP